MKQIIFLILIGLWPIIVLAQEVTHKKDTLPWMAPKDSTVVKLTVFLEGPYDNGKIITELNKNDLIPLIQPYNIPPWNYPGNESVSVIPNGHVVDWVLVDVRAADSAGAASSGTIFSRKAGFLMDNGSIMNPDGMTLLSFDTVFS
jgi:hypothetical protein